ncbi:hypothetical protein HELRODRAFT_193143 [Helobdella robusta]|uniref:Uncharacterized protein n=1 Tax=Helobdella robusta TaxID=6412 RepID=T1FUN6_HELRO|nr:hypothetical protein HELRODRAFT_193143 [Helobdella robusta]ESN97915.1 hypothetical protein HELRODRAFT_193143 [Helobdella robusta]
MDVMMFIRILLNTYLLASLIVKPSHMQRNNWRKRHSVREKKSMSTFFNELLGGYKADEPPMKDRPTEVHIGIYINSFFSISEQTMDYSVSMYLRQHWRDPRLCYIPLSRKTISVRLGNGLWKYIWIPDTFIRNEKRATFHEVTVENRLLRLNTTGYMWYVTKITATLSCMMKLQKYPLDTQTCQMMFESFGNTMDTMYYTWFNNSIEIEKNLELPQFSLIKTLEDDCSQNYTAGFFSCLSLEFVLHRDIGFFIIQVYIPSMLIVILSWVSFWINIDASPARVSLGLLTVLTTTTMSGGARESLPRVSYIKAIDVWMIVCLVFVFASLIEYAVVNVVSRKVRSVRPSSTNENRLHIHTMTSLFRATNQSSGANDEFCHSTNNNCHNLLDYIAHLFQFKPSKENKEVYGATSCDKSRDIEESRRKARSIDKVARKAFPLGFVIFNLIYWLYYTQFAV